MKKVLLLWLSIVAILAGCNKNIPDEPQPKPEEGKRGNIEKIFNTEGGKVTTEQGIEVVVPQGAFKEESKVILKFPNVHPELPQNAQGIRYISKPFTINIEADSLYTPIDLRIPIEEGVAPKDVVVIAIFDHPESLRTIQTDQEKLQECITLKLTEWSKNVIHAKFGAYNRFTQNGIEKKAPTNQAYHVCVVELSREKEKEKERIEKSQRGLLRVVTAPISNPIKLSATYDIKEQDNVLVLVHGWRSSPSDCWSVFANYIVNQGYIKGDKKQYDKILTFGYDSGRHIDENGKDFAEYIKTKLKGAKVDIVAHSMGGLVARSAIENHEVAKYVRSLITLGTPHLGTMSASVPFLVDVLGYIKNVKDTDGGRDLAYDSNFITELDANSEPSSVSYYYIAGGWPKKLPYGDGIVHLFSALRLKVYSWGEFEKSQYNGRIFIPVSHVGLHDNQEVINFVMQKFKEFADASETEDVVLRNTVFSDDFNGTELDLNKWEKSSYPDAVRVYDGVLKMEQNITDAKIELWSKYRYKATQHISISRKVALFPAGNNFFPLLDLVFDNNKRLVIEYSKHSYMNKYGTYVICIDEDIKKYIKEDKLANPIFNAWFNEKIDVDVAKSELNYYQNGQLLGTVHLKGLSLSTPFRIRMHPYGWYTGHKHYTDDFRLEVR